MANVQVITNYFPAIDPSKTSTLVTDKCEIPKHFKALEIKHCWSIKEPSVFG